MNAAIYCRFSTNKQREASLEDQARNCRRVAEREGWQIVKTYKDQGISGSRADRMGYQSMLADAKAGQFQVLLVDDISRLSRDQIEGESAFRRLEHWGVRVLGVADGYDSAAKGRKVHRGFKSLMNELYLDDLAERTHRGLEGQARAGNNAGGRAYGYRHVPVEDASRHDAFGRPLVVAVKREIDKKQADTVRRILEWYADGFSPRWIADELNRLKVPSAGATWRRTSKRRDAIWLASAISGDMQKGTGILNNDLYRGVYIWNRSRWVRDPETHRRVRQNRPESEWVRQDLPHLRIVSDTLWRRVKDRQAEVRQKSANLREALHRSARTGREPKYLLSGLLKCGLCRANFVIGDKHHYVCASHTNGGRHACSNRLRISRTLAESKLLASIKAELLAPECLDEFKREVRALLAASRSHRKADQEARAKRLAALKREIANLVEAIASGLLSPTLRAKLDAAEREHADLASYRDDTAATVSDLLPRLGDTYRELVENLERVPLRQMAKARESLKQLIGDVRLMPADDGKSVDAELSLETGRLLRSAAGQQINVVAGAGFEPATFGL